MVSSSSADYRDFRQYSKIIGEGQMKLVFMIQREVFTIEIEGRNIYYADRKLKNKIRLIPIDKKLEIKIRLSRNKLPTYLLDMFNLTEEEQKEYDAATSEDELAELCIKDCKRSGADLLKREL